MPRTPGVLIAKSVDARVLADAVREIERHGCEISKEAHELADKITEILEERYKNSDRPTFLRFALTLLAAARIVLYATAEGIYQEKTRHTGEMPGEKIVYTRRLSETLEAAWHLSVSALSCDTCEKEDKHLYI